MAEVLRIGAFFDGTGNNMWNDLAIEDGSQTNVAKLYDLYKRQGYVAFYEEGVGTEAYKADGEKNLSAEDIADIQAGFKSIGDLYDPLAMATGSTVKDHVESMLVKINDIIKQHPDKKIVIDVYGFSRGAAEARDFINEVNKLYANLDGSSVVGFVGLFDTVGSIGLAADYDWGLNLNLAENSAERIVQITAEDEKRANFPLDTLDPLARTADNVTEISLPGAHSDIGGGYGALDQVDTYMVEDTYRSEVFFSNSDIEARIAEREAEVQALKTANPGVDYELIYEVTQSIEISDTYELESIIVEHRGVEYGLSNVAMNEMYDQIIASGVELPELSSLGSFTFPGDNETYSLWDLERPYNVNDYIHNSAFDNRYGETIVDWAVNSAKIMRATHDNDHKKSEIALLMLADEDKIILHKQLFDIYSIFGVTGKHLEKLDDYSEGFVEHRAEYLHLYLDPDQRYDLADTSDNLPSTAYIDFITGQEYIGARVADIDEIIFGSNDSEELRLDQEWHSFITSGNQIVYGKNGNDVIYTGDGNDILEGGKGNDTLQGGKDNDTLDGGSGVDTYIINSGDGHDTIIDTGQNILIIDGEIINGVFEQLPESTDYKFVGESRDYILTFEGGMGKIIIDADTSLTFDLQKSPADFDNGDFGIHTKDTPTTPSEVLDGTVDGDCLEAGTESATIDALTGEDMLVGSAGADQLNAGDGDDWVFANGGADQIDAGAGNDYITGLGAESVVNAGDGNDLVASVQSDWMEINNPNSPITTSAFWSDLRSHWNSHSYSSDLNLANNGYLETQFSSGFQTGSFSGNSALGDSWTYQIDVSLTSITATYYHPTEAVNGISPASSWAHAMAPNPLTSGVILNGGAGDDLLIGNAGADHLSGGTENDTLHGNDGDDMLNGGAGDDTLVGGAGDDTIQGDVGNDVIYGESGADVVFGGDGNDLIWGRSSTDTLTDLDEGDLLYGDAGDDQLVGNEGDDILSGGDGADGLFGGIGNDLLNGDAGNDKLMANEGNDVLVGGDGDDGLWGHEGNDTLEGGVGVDSLYGGAGDDSYVFKLGDGIINASVMDRIDDQEGNNTLIFDTAVNVNDLAVFSGGGEDIYLKYSANDYVWLAGGLNGQVNQVQVGHQTLTLVEIINRTLTEDIAVTGDENDNFLAGGSGNDTLVGGLGNDFLSGGGGVDTLDGGEGDDTYFFSLGDSPFQLSGPFEEINDVHGVNVVSFGDGISVPQISTSIENNQDLFFIIDNQNFFYVRDGLNGSVKSYEFASGEQVDWRELVGETCTTAISRSTTDSNSFLFGGLANDSLTATGGNSIFDGGQGDDVLTGAGGNNTYLYSLGDGTDTLNDTGAQADPEGNLKPNRLVFGEGINQADLKLSLGSLRIQVGANADDVIVINNFNAEDVYAQRAIDLFEFADGAVLTYEQLLSRSFDISGGDGDDSLTGTNVQDRILAGAGDDTLDGGAGDDYLQGGDGHDTYLFGRQSGHVVIEDGATNAIASSGDRVRFVDGITSEELSLVFDGQNILVTVAGETGSITIKNWTQDGSANKIEWFEFDASPSWDQARIFAATGASFSINGTDDNEILNGSDGDDYIAGNGGDDQINGGLGNDVLGGGAGNDFLVGGEGDDEIYGGTGADVLDGGQGSDRLIGGQGDDVYYLRSLTDVIVEDGAASGGTDTVVVDFDLRMEQLTSATGIEKVQAVAPYSRVWGDERDNILLGSDEVDRLWGEGGNDQVYGGGGDDLVFGGAGEDYLSGGDGNDNYDFNFNFPSFAGEDIINDSCIDLFTSKSDLVTLNHAYPLHVYSFRRDQDDLLIAHPTVTTNYQLRLDDWFVDEYARVEYVQVSPEGNAIWTKYALNDLVSTQDWNVAADPLNVRARSVSGTDDEVLALTIEVEKFDPNETIESIYLQGVPAGFNLNKGVDLGSGRWSIQVADLSGLQLIPPTDWAGSIALEIEATSLDSFGRRAITTRTFDAVVEKSPAAPSLSVEDWFEINPGETIPLGIQVQLTDSGETLTPLTLTDVPSDIVLNHGENLGGGTWSVPVEGLAGLAMIVPENTNALEEFFSISLTAGSLESDGQIAYSTAEFEVSLNTDVLGTEGDDVLIGTSHGQCIEGYGGNDTIIGGGGDDSVYGGDGDDTYVYNSGDGFDYIEDDSSGIDTIRFGPGIAPDDLSGYYYYNAQWDSGNYELYLPGDGGIAVDNRDFIEFFEFNDGSVYSYKQLMVALGLIENVAPTVSGPADLGSMLEDDEHLLTTSELLANSTDVDGDSLSVNNLTADRGRVFENTDGTWIYQPEENMHGLVNFDYLVSDGIDTMTATATLSVTAVNDAPVIDTPLSDQVAEQDDAFSFQVPVSTFYDYDTGDNLNYVATLEDGSALPAWLNFDTNSGAFIGIPSRDDLGNLEVKVTATDSAGESVSDHFRLDIILPSISGTENSEQIYGSISSELINGLGGDDDLFGLEGNDVLLGGQGNDRLYGSSGDDILDASSGDDILDGGPGNDILYGLTGDDTYIFSPGFGQDTIRNYDYVEGRLDVVEFTEGIDASAVLIKKVGLEDLVLEVEGTTDQLTLKNYFKDDGASPYVVDEIRFADGTVWSVADIKAMLMAGTEGDDTLFGSDGDDTIQGLGGNDYIDGNKGDDTLFGGYGDDTLVGGKGYDRLYGEAGNDFLYGKGGNDILYGGDGNDFLRGTSGYDILDGGADKDILSGGSSNDSYCFGLGDGIDRISDSSGIDTIEFDSDVDKNGILFLKTGTTMKIGYGVDDEITMRRYADSTTGNRIETITLTTGEYLTDADINQIVQDMAAYATTEGINLTSIDDVRQNEQLMTMIANSWNAA